MGPRPVHRDLVAPITARACYALQAVLKGARRQGDSGPCIMPRGAERC
jgi:hypothetical protein